MTYAPATLLELRAFLAPKTGLSAGNLGIVGDTAHADRGTSYHLGRDQLTSDAYSRQTARDRAGLTNAASAMDIGNHPDLRRLSKALVAACQRDAVGTRDIREVIYSPDGIEVLRWDRERGFASKPWPMLDTPLNNSHRWHTHVSYYRDSEHRDKLAVFRPLYPDTTGDDMPLVAFTAPDHEVGGTITTKADTAAIPLSGEAGERLDVPAGITRPALGVFKLTALADRPCYLMLVGPRLAFIAAASVDFVPDVPVEPAPGPETHKVALTINGQTKYEVEV